MAGNDSAQQKTEKPTQRRRRKARQEGQVALSQEVGNAFSLLAMFTAFLLFGGAALGTLLDQLRRRLGDLSGPVLTLDEAPHLLAESFGLLGRTVFPMMCFVGAVGLLATVSQTGLLFTPRALAPRWEALNPVAGFKRLVSLRSLVKLAIALAKVGVIAALVALALRPRLPQLYALIHQSPWGVLETLKALSAAVLLRVAALMLVLAVLDYAYERWRYEKQLMMTRAELKEERKRDEGRPEVKGRLMQMRREISRQRMMQAVPEATVVVTNPTHVAVALKWDEQTMDAPQVVAKGRHLLAERIKQIAREHGVPVLERRMLARALYEAVEVGRSIPPALYLAVARVLAFVMKKRPGAAKTAPGGAR